jgi:ferredoxin
MKRVYSNDKNCSGCTACYNVCPVSAITMEEDKLGFKYPRINQDKCVDCGLCKKVCPFKKIEQISNPIKVLAAKHKNEDIRMKNN